MRRFLVLCLMGGLLALGAAPDAAAQDNKPQKKTRSPLTTDASPPSSGAGSFANDMTPAAQPPVPVNAASQPQTIFQNSSFSQADQAFLHAALQGGIFEIQTGEFAGRNGAIYRVRHLGRVMAHDHAILNDSLYRLARDEGLVLPTSANATTRNRIGALTALSGRAFDRAYVRALRAAHRDDIAAFQQEAARTRNPRLRDLLVNDALPVLRHHLAMANDSYSAVMKKK